MNKKTTAYSTWHCNGIDLLLDEPKVMGILNVTPDSFFDGSKYSTLKTQMKKAEKMLDAGVAREVARVVLPVATYSSMYVTMNARALMNFLSLRTSREGSHFPSYPQREIEMVAEKMEAEFAKLMPLTYGAFQKSGRVAP